MVENIRVLSHSSIQIRSSIGTVYLDPFRVLEEFHDADYILVTHDHYDHFSSEDIAKVAKPESILIVPENMRDKAEEVKGMVGKIETVVPGQKCTIGDLALETIPAYNKLKPFHPKKNGWVGYIVALDGKRIYVAGDTDLVNENRGVACDIALVPVGGTYTMDAKKAAELVNTIRPEIAIPTHYGSVVGKAEDAETFASLVDPSIQVAVKLETL